MSTDPVTAKPKKFRGALGCHPPATHRACASVGRSGNDLHYRGLRHPGSGRRTCEFEELLAYLLIPRGKLPNVSTSSPAYKDQAQEPARAIPAPGCAANPSSSPAAGQRIPIGT